MQGEIDLMDQYIATPNNKSVLYDAREQGGYDFYTLTSTEANVMNFILNLNHSDETKRALFQNRDFRAALSTAIDRQSLIDAVLVGQGAPAQPSIKKEDPLYNEQLATQFTAYDVDKANAMLDKIIPKKDDQNFRRLAPALTLDATARLPIAAGFGIELRAENLTDARVEAGISGANLVERASPRTLWIALSYHPVE